MFAFNADADFLFRVLHRIVRLQGVEQRGLLWIGHGYPASAHRREPGRDPVQPMTTRQLNRACHAAAQMAEIDKRVSLHTLRHSFATSMTA